MFLAHRTPLENQAMTHNYALGGAPPAAPSPSAVPPTPAPDPANPPPIGSSPANVADNIPAKISEGEFVVPADVVKFFGLDHFQKLIGKAKEGMLGMAQQGLIKGNGPPVAHTPDDPETGARPPEATGAAAGGFFAPPGHPQHYAMGGFQSYAEGGYAAGGLSTSLSLPMPSAGLATPSLHIGHTVGLPSGGHSPISGMIPHNTGIIHSGVKGPLHNGTSFTHASVAAPHVKMADGGFMNTDMSQMNSFSAGGQPGSMMTPYQSPVAPMTDQPDTYAAQQRQSQNSANQAFMQPYS